MTLRRLVLAALAAFCAVAAGAAPAEAAPTQHRHLPISAVTLAREGAGTLIRITYAGAARLHTRILRSQDPIDAFAVADVDNDGDLDILAAQQGGGLVLWRNAGRGRFVAAAAPHARALSRGEPGIRSLRDTDDSMQSGDEQYSAAMPRAPATTDHSLDTPHPVRASSLVLSASIACPQGRAPPSVLA